MSDQTISHAEVFDKLTAREQEVLALMSEGLANPTIAERLVITTRAVEKHVSNILWKTTGMFVDERDYDRRVLAVVNYLNAGSSQEG